MLAGDVVKVDVGRDTAVLIDTVKPPPYGNIKLPNLSFTVELAHGLILLTCAASPGRWNGNLRSSDIGVRGPQVPYLNGDLLERRKAKGGGHNLA